MLPFPARELFTSLSFSVLRILSRWLTLRSLDSHYSCIVVSRRRPYAYLVWVLDATFCCTLMFYACLCQQGRETTGTRVRLVSTKHISQDSVTIEECFYPRARRRLRRVGSSPACVPIRPVSVRNYGIVVSCACARHG